MCVSDDTLNNSTFFFYYSLQNQVKNVVKTKLRDWCSRVGMKEFTDSFSIKY